MAGVCMCAQVRAPSPFKGGHSLPAKPGTRCARKERRIKCVKRNECRWEKEGRSGRSVFGAGAAVAGRVSKVEGGFDVWGWSAAGERVVMYLLKFRPLCLIHNICSPFPSFPPAVHSHVYRHNKARRYKFPHRSTPPPPFPPHPSPLASMFLPFYLLSFTLPCQPSTPHKQPRLPFPLASSFFMFVI